MHRILILAAVVIFAAVHWAHADDQQPERKPEADLPKLSADRPNPAAERKPAPGQPANLYPAAGAAVWGGGKSMAEWYIERTDKIVGLSDEQKQKIKAEYESRDKATKEFQTSIEAKAKSVTAEMTEAFKSQDKDAIAKSQQAYQELYAPLFELTKKSDAALQNILTAEQRTKLSDNQFASMLTALAPGEAAQSNVKVTQIPGGGIQVIFSEGGEAREGNAPQQRLQVLQRQLMEVVKQAPSDNKASLRERVKRQHELTKQASKLMKKIDGLGEGDKAKAHELWEELERVEGQLRQTFGPAQSSLIPGQPAAGWMVVSRVQAPGAPVQLPGALLNPAARHGAGAPIIVAPPGGGFGTARVLNVAPGAAQPDVHAELQALRRQVEELRAQMQRLSEKK